MNDGDKLSCRVSCVVRSYYEAVEQSECTAVESA